jgi:hypothetical protein
VLDASFLYKFISSWNSFIRTGNNEDPITYTTTNTLVNSEEIIQEFNRVLGWYISSSIEDRVVPTELTSVNPDYCVLVRLTEEFFTSREGILFELYSISQLSVLADIIKRFQVFWAKNWFKYSLRRNGLSCYSFIQDNVY